MPYRKVGGNFGGQSSGTGQRGEGPAATPKAPPKALVTKEMMTSVRPKSPPNPPRSPRISSPQVSTAEVGNRWSSSLRTPRATIEEENTGGGGSAEVDDLLPDRGGIDLPTDTFNDGEGPTEAELHEFTGDVEMKPEEEAEVPVEGKGNAPDREAEVPQAAAAVSQPSVELPTATASPDREGRKAKGPVDTQKKDETPGPTGPGMPISYAPKYADDDGDLRDTASTPKGASTSLEGAYAIM